MTNRHWKHWRVFTGFGVGSRDRHSHNPTAAIRKNCFPCSTAFIATITLLRTCFMGSIGLLFKKWPGRLPGIFGACRRNTTSGRGISSAPEKRRCPKANAPCFAPPFCWNGLWPPVLTVCIPICPQPQRRGARRPQNFSLPLSEQKSLPGSGRLFLFRFYLELKILKMLSKGSSLPSETGATGAETGSASR